MILTAKQNFFLDKVASGENLFLTGKAGTGKSTIVKEALDRLKSAGKKVVAIAPTGVAANNIEGQTIHSMFNLVPFGVLDFETCQFLSPAKKSLLRKVETIVIDEVSMLRPDTLDAIHYTLKKNGLVGLDKRQVIFVGDLKQLPPILNDNTRSVLYQKYDGDTFIFAEIYEKLNVQLVELDEVVRQTDEEFIEALNIVRDGGKAEYFRRFVSKEPTGIVLAPHNATVKAYNEKGLAAQGGEMLKFIADITGTAKPEDFNLEHEIRVKDGCKIMYLVNSQENPLRNGTLGTFVAGKGKYFIQVGGVKFALNRVELTKKEYVYDKASDSLQLRELGKIEQFPFKLAYALSIHKAQGLTFDEVTIDLSLPVFQKGQMYVALSRVRTPQGLKILTALNR